MWAVGWVVDRRNWGVDGFVLPWVGVAVSWGSVKKRKKKIIIL